VSRSVYLSSFEFFCCSNQLFRSCRLIRMMRPIFTLGISPDATIEYAFVCPMPSKSCNCRMLSHSCAALCGLCPCLSSDSLSLREWVARALKRDEVPDPIWEDAVEDGWVKDVLEGSVDRDEFLKTIRQWRKRYERMRKWEEGRQEARSSKRGREEPELITPRLGDRETQRAQAVEEYVAKVAACERSVFAFRKRFLGGTTLSPAQADAIITSPAAAYLPFEYFTPFGDSRIPLLDHSAALRTDSPESDEVGQYSLAIFVDPPGETFRVDVQRTERLLYIDEDGQTQETLVEDRSVLEGLRRLSTYLAAEYPWQEEHSTWFVLTGEPPALPAATGRVSRGSAAPYAEITLTVQPWVPADTVRKFYGQLQRRVLTSRPRALSERNLTVFRFIVEQQEVKPYRDKAPASELTRRHPKLMRLKQPSWRVMLKRWNRHLPAGHKWHYQYVQNFQRDFRRAAQAIVSPHVNRSSVEGKQQRGS
jgi:hypothetical protein